MALIIIKVRKKNGKVITEYIGKDFNLNKIKDNSNKLAIEKKLVKEIRHGTAISKKAFMILGVLFAVLFISQIFLIDGGLV